MRHLTRAIALSSVCLFAPAAHAAGYAVLALIGDEMTIVTYQPAVGSNLDANDRQKVTLGDDVFDRSTDLAVDTAIRRAASGATTKIVTVADPALRARSEDIVESPERLKALVAPISAQVGPDVRWLLLVTKHRDDTRLRVANGDIGAGKLSGLGFYIDRHRRLTRSDTGESGRGFLAPYAYLSVSLVDLTTGDVVRTRSVSESTTLSSARNPSSFDPWEAVPPQRKIQILQGMVRHAVDVNVPLLLAPS